MGQSAISATRGDGERYGQKPGNWKADLASHGVILYRMRNICVVTMGVEPNGLSWPYL